MTIVQVLVLSGRDRFANRVREGWKSTGEHCEHLTCVVDLSEQFGDDRKLQELLWRPEFIRVFERVAQIECVSFDQLAPCGTPSPIDGLGDL